MKILLYPDSHLNKPCNPVTEFDESLGAVIDKMKEVMLAAKGLGLSANQVGLNEQIFVMQDKKKNVHEFINPVILEFDGSLVMSEGCLSVPKIYLNIARPESVVVQFQDRTGATHKVMAEGLEARIIQHEFDHLKGLDFFSKVNRQTRKAALKEYEKSKK